MHVVAVLTLDDVVPFDLGTPTQLFGAARDSAGEPLYQVLICTADGGPVRTTAGFTVVPDHGMDVLERADTVLVPGFHDSPTRHDGTLEPAVAEALRSAWRRGARIMSICTGAAALAAAGLLDGRPATTHWRYTDRFRELFPLVTLDPNVLFVDDGEILTSAGVGAGIDLCLHVIRRDHGSEIANRAARRSVVPPWRDGGQAQYIERPVVPAAEAGTAHTRAWAIERLGESLSLRELAAHASMSVRTFTRRFREETGVSPARWLLVQRLDQARQLLERTDLGIDQIAQRVGFGTATSLRQHLNASIGVSPSTYRRTFRRP